VAEGGWGPPGAEAPAVAALDAAFQRIAAAPEGASVAAALPLEGPWAMMTRAFAGPWLSGMPAALVDARDWALARTGEDWLVPGGYGALVARAGAGVAVELDCPARAVVVRPGGVRVETAKGAIEAAHAVLTVPLGVLAAGAIALTPALPAPALAALEALPMGDLVKVGLVFAGDPFGLGDGCYLLPQARSEAAVLHLVRPAGLPLVYGFLAGGLVREQDAVEAVLEPLSRLFGGGIRRRLVDSRASAWAADPHARGSYAVARPGGARARAVLARLWFERLHLAGEAVAADGWHGTVAGAWLSGEAVAQRIVASMRGALSKG
jgi:monoamine oxidase